MFNLKGNYFEGQYHKPDLSGEVLVKTSPSDKSETLWETSFEINHVDGVIDSAVMGFETWRKTSLEARIKCLLNYKQEVIKKANEIAFAIAQETGKPLWEAKTEAAALAGKVDVTISESLERVKNKTIPQVMPQIDGHIAYKPLGPSLIIGPFNFPCHLANTQILSALLTGNSIIFKPSEKTIYSASLMFDCLVQAGFPKGVINFINGGAEISTKLCRSPQVKGIFFTGSKAVGLHILKNTYEQIDKTVALELGGKNTTIIHQDATEDHCLSELIRSCFLTSGQRCTSTSLIAIHQSVADSFIEKFKSLTERIIIDHATKYKVDPFMGPLIDEAAVKKYLEICQVGEKEGAQLIYGNKKIELDYEGNYVSPSIYRFDNCNLTGEYIQTEIFGPNCTFISYENIEEAIKIANSTEYGLAASIFTHDKSIYDLCLRDIDAGLINLNRSTVGASARLPFGGVKSSGNGHPAAVSMIDSTVHLISSLETQDVGSSTTNLQGIK